MSADSIFASSACRALKQAVCHVIDTFAQVPTALSAGPSDWLAASTPLRHAGLSLPLPMSSCRRSACLGAGAHLTRCCGSPNCSFQPVWGDCSVTWTDHFSTPATIVLFYTPSQPQPFLLVPACASTAVPSSSHTTEPPSMFLRLPTTPPFQLPLRHLPLPSFAHMVVVFAQERRIGDGSLDGAMRNWRSCPAPASTDMMHSMVV